MLNEYIKILESLSCRTPWIKGNIWNLKSGYITHHAWELLALLLHHRQTTLLEIVIHTPTCISYPADKHKLIMRPVNGKCALTGAGGAIHRVRSSIIVSSGIVGSRDVVMGARVISRSIWGFI